MKTTGTKTLRTSIDRSRNLELRAVELENIKMLLNLGKKFTNCPGIVRAATDGAKICSRLAIIYKNNAHD